MCNPISPLVSVIVPCYNQAQYLTMALDSIRNQTYQFWECIIVNDGSPDNTDEIATRYCRLDTRFRYVSQNNEGLASARNFGINSALGTYILPLDSDDYIDPPYIEKCIDRFKSNPKIKLVTCYGRYFGDRNEVFGTQKYCYEDFIWRRFLFFCCSMFRKSDFNKTTGYNSNMKYGMEDVDFWLSLLGPDDLVEQIPEPLFHYRIKHVSMNTEMQRKLTESYSQMVLNHLDVYSPYFERLFDYPFLEFKIEQLRNSLSYRLGATILKPAILLRDYFNHKKNRI